MSLTTHTRQSADSGRSHHAERLINARAACGYLSASDLCDLHAQLRLQRGLVVNRQSRHKRKLSGWASLISLVSVECEKTETNAPDFEKEVEAK